MRAAAFAFALAVFLALPGTAALADVALMAVTLGGLRWWLRGVSS